MLGALPSGLSEARASRCIPRAVPGNKKPASGAGLVYDAAFPCFVLVSFAPFRVLFIRSGLCQAGPSPSSTPCTDLKETIVPQRFL